MWCAVCVGWSPPAVGTLCGCVICDTIKRSSIGLPTACCAQACCVFAYCLSFAGGETLQRYLLCLVHVGSQGSSLTPGFTAFSQSSLLPCTSAPPRQNSQHYYCQQQQYTPSDMMQLIQNPRGLSQKRLRLLDQAAVAACIKLVYARHVNQIQ